MGIFVSKRDLREGLELKLPLVVINDLCKNYLDDYYNLNSRTIKEKIDKRELIESYNKYLSSFEKP